MRDMKSILIFPMSGMTGFQITRSKPASHTRKVFLSVGILARFDDEY